MFTLLRRRNFALLWFGGLISLLGDRVLLIALPYFVYQETGSTIATAIMVAAELLPRVLFGSLAGVFVDRWNRRTVMVITSIAQGLVILPLLWVHSGETIWIVYIVSFFQTTLAMFFGPAENALLPLLVGEADLVAANSLNALNNNLARLIGPPLGGVILALWGLPGVVVVDSLSFIIAGLMILAMTGIELRRPSPEAAPAETTDSPPKTDFWKEWLEGLDLVRRNRIVAVLFLTVVLLNFGGIMIDPLFAPFVEDVLRASAAVYGVLATVQAIGGIAAGLIAGWVSQRMSTAAMYGWMEVILGVIMFVRYNIPDMTVQFAGSLLTGLIATLGIAALETLFQQKVPNSHLGRISGALNTTIGFTSFFGVLGISGVLGETLGVVPVLNIAATVTLVTGLIALMFLPTKHVEATPAGNP